MAGGMQPWLELDLRQYYDLADEQEGEENGLFCRLPSSERAVPLLYQGDPAFLQWLGAQLVDLEGKLGRLRLSRLVTTLDGKYYAQSNDQVAILTTVEAGPTCDAHNTFELFTIAAGLAHVHSLTQGVAWGSRKDWSSYYQSLQEKLEQLEPPVLPRKVISAWTILEETWRLCLEQASTLSAALSDSASITALVLGAQTFADFVYLPDLHCVHYNQVASCRIDSPAIELARLMAATGEVKLAENLLLSYQRVRQISPAEGREILAHLWFPREIELMQLYSQQLNALSIRRFYGMLQAKIALISELEELLLTVEEADGSEKEVFDMAHRKEPNVDSVSKTDILTVADRVGLENNQPIGISKTEEREVLEPRAKNADQVMLSDEQPKISLDAKKETRPLVWKPFPRPIGAPEPDTEVRTGELADTIMEDGVDESAEALTAPNTTRIPI